ncbi:MAG: glycerol-3-phosphate acyltransferase [Coriobacteriales bacterium]|jgi:glycerol-3-phosphate acyltransferase PlsY
MSPLAGRAVCLLIGYLFGCFLTADILTRRKLGKSAFEVGSKNPGMANIGALMGVKGAAVVLAGDIVKTIMAVLVANLACLWLLGLPELAQPDVPLFTRIVFPHSGTAATLWAGVGATLGHNYPFWHRFGGGKGVTTTCSAVILFHPVLGLAACLAGLAVAALSKQLCFGAMTIVTVFAIEMGILAGWGEQLVGALVLFVCMLFAHGAPCWRALHGEEPQAALFTRRKG